MRKELRSPPRPLILTCLLLLIPALLETVLAYVEIGHSATLEPALWVLALYSLLALGLLARVQTARFVAIFWLAAFGVISIIMLVLPILQMFPLRYFTLEAAFFNSAALLYVAGMFAAAAWLNGKEGHAWFASDRRQVQKSPNKSLNSDAGKAGAG